jgi:hypothetical protein
MIFLLVRSALVQVRPSWFLFTIALACANTWLWPVSAVAAQADRKNECLVAYADAQEQRMRGELLAARDQLLICSEDACPRPIQHDCAEWLRDVERDLSSVVFAVIDEAGHDLPAANVLINVLINDKPLANLAEGRAQLLNPGSYEYSVEAPGYLRGEGTLVMRQSEKNRIVRVTLERPGQPLADAAAAESALRVRESDSGLHVPTASIVLGATALVGVAGFAYFGLRGQAKRADADSCTMSCGPLIDSGKRDYIVADISLGVAVAAAGSAIVFALLDHSSSRNEAATRLSMTPTSLEWQLRF